MSILLDVQNFFMSDESHQRKTIQNGPDLLQSIRREALVVAVFDDLVGVHDDRDEEGEDDVDEEADEEVEVDSAAMYWEGEDGNHDDDDDDLD